ncbi:MAG: alpha/beta fold hydrolase [Dehalococcoidia bacterium]
MIRRLGIAISIITGAPMIVAWFISQRVLHPTPKLEDHSLDDFDLPAEEISFRSRDGTRLSGWFVRAPADGPAPAVVLSHGHGRSRAELLPHADFLHRAGYAVLAFDYRHRGTSEGAEVTMGLREQDDLLGAIDELAARPDIDAGRMGVLGLSMGGVVGMLVAARDERVRALVAESPYASPDAIMTRALRHFYHLPSFPFAYVGRWLIERRLGEPLAVPDAVGVVREISPRPLLFIADGDDAVVGPEEAQRLYDAAGEPKQLWLIPEAGHSRGWQAAPAEYERRVLEFLGAALAQRAESPVHAQR